jgi:NTE family protein
MTRGLAFSLGGGGARGALQVGALRALIESGVVPDILIGTSVGAVNAAFVGIRGVNLSTIDELTLAWHDAMSAELLPSNFLWFIVRSMFKTPYVDSFHRLKDFFLQHGMSPELRFSEINQVRLFLVASDLNSGSPVIYGMDQEDQILDGLLASTALPPWVSPMLIEERYLMDGGVVSPLPIEPAMQVGATSIIAFDITDDRDVPHDASGFGPFIAKLISTVGTRQRNLELQIAQARRIPVFHLKLTGREPVALWDFSHTDELISLGYEFTQKAIRAGELNLSRNLILKLTTRFTRLFHPGTSESQ